MKPLEPIYAASLIMEFEKIGGAKSEEAKFLVQWAKESLELAKNPPETEKKA